MSLLDKGTEDVTVNGLGIDVQVGVPSGTDLSGYRDYPQLRIDT